MEIETLIKLIVDNGVTVGLLVYFCWFNVKYMSKIDGTLSRIDTLLDKLTDNDK